MPAGKGTYGSKVGRPKTTKKGNVRKGAKMPGSRLAFDDTKQEKKKVKREAVSGGGWMAHVRKTRKAGESWKAALVRASKTYKK